MNNIVMLGMIDGRPMLWDRSKLHWIELMRRDKAAMILEAFDTENEELFLVLGDWMEDAGESPEEIQRFRNGNWTRGDYDAATISMYWKQIGEAERTPSRKVFAQWLRKMWGHKKFLEWMKKYLKPEQLQLLAVMEDDKKFQQAYGEAARLKIKGTWTRPTEGQLRLWYEEAREICFILRKKEDSKAWRELWKYRRWYVRRGSSTNPCAEIVT